MPARGKYVCSTCGKKAMCEEGCHAHKQSAREAVRKWWAQKVEGDPDFKKKCNQEYYEKNKDILKEKMREYSRLRYQRLKQQKQDAQQQAAGHEAQQTAVNTDNAVNAVNTDNADNTDNTN